ncbi:MAG: YbhB/YbcL family Raf kinase inhibitor-like protein [Proteobacteria bacterium]|nr:YbhB/YbcL family Raf kinase inhibitor-like protein [Pseudomonadota bacterium]
MEIWSDSFENGQPIPARYAFGKPHPTSHVQLSDNVNPHIAWSDLPVGTRSLALLCVDVDVPSKPDAVNKEGMTVPAKLARVDFYHWILVDLAPEGGPLQEGEFSSAVTAKGKPGPEGPRGTRQGVNSYREWFERDPSMTGDYFGYDGPCPPWNDERVHHYDFRLYALDVPRCPAEGNLRGPEVLVAIQGHILDKALLVGSYQIYPEARAV